MAIDVTPIESITYRAWSTLMYIVTVCLRQSSMPPANVVPSVQSLGGATSKWHCNLPKSSRARSPQRSHTRHAQDSLAQSQLRRMRVVISLSSKIWMEWLHKRYAQSDNIVSRYYVHIWFFIKVPIKKSYCPQTSTFVKPFYIVEKTRYSKILQILRLILHCVKFM